MRKRIGLILVIVLLASLWPIAQTQAMHSDSFTFFIPYSADDLSAQFDAGHDVRPIDEDLVITISVSVLRSGTIVVYDHWEDGLEPNFGIRTQASTEVWGDGDTSNGVPQNIPSDIFSAGQDVAVQRSLVDVPRDSTDTPFPYDGGDQVVAVGGSIAVTMTSWPEILPLGPGYLYAGAWELYPTSRWGTDYVIPVGVNLSPENAPPGSDSRGGFRTVGLNVQVVEDGTEISIEDPISGRQETVTRDRGQNYSIPNGINAGTTVSASAPVQVHVFAANPQANYEARAYTMVPRIQWTGDYLAPRSSDGDYWFYNPNDSDLVVTVQTITGPDSFTIPANGNARYPAAVSPTATGMRFTASGDFYGVAALDDADAQDWGYALQPVENLTSQALVGWAPGNRLEFQPLPPPPAGTTGFESRVYVTATEATTVTVDYVGDGSQVRDYSVPPLTEVPITDEVDFDMTGARLYTDGVPFVAVWGQDQAANPGDPSIDVGTSVVPLRAPSIQKTYTLVEEAYNCGTVSRPTRVRFELQAFNDSITPIPNFVVTDDLPAGLTYVPGSTKVDGSGIDDNNGRLPLEGGYNVGTLDQGDSILITFDAWVETTDPVENEAVTNPDSDPAIAELTPPFRQGGYQVTKTLIAPPDGLVDPGQTITFNVTISNTGNVDITQLPVRDEFTATTSALTFVNASERPDSDGDPADGVIAWNDLTSTFGRDLVPGDSFSLTLTFRALNPLPLNVFDTINIVLSEGLQGSDGLTQAIVCDEALVSFDVPTPTPTPTRTSDDGDGDDDREDPTPTPTPSITVSTPTPPPPPPAPTPAVLFLPETGIGHSGTQPTWPLLALPGLGLLVGWVVYRRRRDE